MYKCMLLEQIECYYNVYYYNQRVKLLMNHFLGWSLIDCNYVHYLGALFFFKDLVIMASDDITLQKIS